MLRLISRFYSTEALVSKSARRKLFDQELNLQLQSAQRRLSKITVVVDHLSQGLTLTMNRDISTPLDCARHIQEYLVNQSVLALVNGQPHDMNRPLTDHCSLKFINFRSENCQLANLAFWRSCSFLTNWVLETCFAEDFQVDLCSFPAPDLRSGSFVTDVQLRYRGDPDFDPGLLRDLNLRSVSRTARQLIFENHSFVPLAVSLPVAEAVFAECPLKLRQLPGIVEGLLERHSDGGAPRIPLYRVGDHVDICRGPLVSSTGHVGRFKLTAVYPISTEDYGRLYRVQGVAVPLQLPTHHSSFELLAKRAEQPNQTARLPQLRRKPTSPSIDAISAP